jgi:carbamoyl-phosphate synthase large subunit
MIGQVQVDKSLLGWKEYELEVVRDRNDNCVIVCGIENIDAMGVHTGDSVTVAPILTLTDKEYQVLRDASLAIMREVGVETGGSNVQFAVNPNPPMNPDGSRDFEFVVVEMNPRVSRVVRARLQSHRLPDRQDRRQARRRLLARRAAQRHHRHDQRLLRAQHRLRRHQDAPLDVREVPRGRRDADDADEVRRRGDVDRAHLQGAFQKVIRSMDVKRFGLGLDRNDKWLAATRAAEKMGKTLETVAPQPAASPTVTDDTTTDPNSGARVSLGLRTADGQPIEWPIPEEKLHRKLGVPSQGRLYYIRYALKMGWTVEPDPRADPHRPVLHRAARADRRVRGRPLRLRRSKMSPRDVLFEAKAMGFSDAQLANLYLGTISSETILKVRRHRESLGDHAGLQVRGYLRRRVRGHHAVLLLHLSSEAGPRSTRRATPSSTPPRTRSRAIPRRRKSSSSAAGPTASARASSSTTAASTPPSPPRNSATSR